MKALTKIQEEKVEIFNSVSWLCLDACWMFSLKPLCYTMMIPTVLSGLLLFIGVKALSLKLANLGILSWSLMNIFWMCSEFLENKDLMWFAYGFFALGAGLILFVITNSPKTKQVLVKRIAAIRNLVKKQGLTK